MIDEPILAIHQDIGRETYLERVNAGQEPEKLDKDACRDYVKSKCDPYNEPTRNSRGS